MYNIGTSEEYENVSVVKTLIDIFYEKHRHLLLRLPEDFATANGASSPTASTAALIEYVRDRAFNDFRYHIDSSALESLGWRRQTDVTFKTQLEHTVQWYLSRPNYWSTLTRALLPHNGDETASAEHEKKLAQQTASAENIKTQPAQQTALAVAPEKLAQASTDQLAQQHWLIYGHQGWIGQQLVCHLTRLYPNDKITLGAVRADNADAIRKELACVLPDRVISLVGRTSGPGCSTIDYLEQKGNLKLNVRDNLLAPMVLMLCCLERNIHLTYMGTGCIFAYDQAHKNPDDGRDGLGSLGTRQDVLGFTETDSANFFGSSYSTVKGTTDTLFREFGKAHCLNVRIRMPITEDITHPRNFLTKILSYKKICSVENSMSVLPELLPIMLKMSREKCTGTINLTNPGTISHNRILQLYKEIVNPDFTWENFTVQEQNKILAAERSNNFLDTKRLESIEPTILNIEQAISKLLRAISH